ncbi:PepSY-associated TM helix domain-containing protein [Sediminitomix flava]|uniref:Putative iron-regulated membrane protein n=1 Tax=Sediminitomix flava TaxID=379075 RepID=A0A315ZCG3_SEDFL|nr:PepSY-associated TM helix domain-containing protein [Sediminitomix flava]PWJ43221.1 putative iron-regulated membrane protein [Sediminitomix flava]
MLKGAAKHQKDWYGKWHTWAGITAGFVLIIVSLTGSLLVFEEELDVWFYQEQFHFPHQKGDAKLSFQQVMDKLKKEYPTHDLHGLFAWETRNDAYIAYGHPEGKDIHLQYIINPYTAEVTAEREYHKTVMGFIRNLHRTLLIPEVGKYLVGISSLICTILMITGLRLWIPKKWKNVKARLGIKWGASSKRVNFDLHNTLGFYFSPMITLISITGVVITFSQFVFLFLFLLSFQSPQSIASILDQKSNYYEGAKPLSVNQLQEIAESQLDNSVLLGFNTPHDSIGTYSMNVWSPSASEVGNRSIFWLDQYSGEVVYSSEKKELMLGKMYLNWVTPIHYGTFGGLPTRILALIASLICATLFITGFIIWLPRWRKGKNKKVKQSKSKVSPQKVVEA